MPPPDYSGPPGPPDSLLFFMVMTFLVFGVLPMAGLWGMFVKAGKPGWLAIVPLVNLAVWLDIVGRPAWWIILLLIPCINYIIMFTVALDTARCFGRGALVGVGVALLPSVVLPVLGLGSAQYRFVRPD